jgi:hypothetical protein
MTSGTRDESFLGSFNNWWGHMIWEYTKCGLTRLEDKLIALSGIAARVQSRTGLTYLAGV